MNQKIPFVFKSVSYDTKKVFYACLDSEIYKTEHLLQALYYLLWFPGYFGFNWDALNDCLTDFSWIPKKLIVIEHSGLPKIPEADLSIYLQILRDAVLSWKVGENHRLEVIFSENDRLKIVELLGRHCNAE